MTQRSNNVLRVNTVEEQADYKDAVAEILRNIQHDERVTLVEISERIGLENPTTISNAANKKCVLNPIYLKRLGQVFGPHCLDPYAALAGGRMVQREMDGSSDILPILTGVSHNIAAARSPTSPGGVSETLREQLGYLPELRRLQREIGALIHVIEARKDAA